MKSTQTTGIRNLEKFQKLLTDRIDALERRAGTRNADVYTGTERLLIHLAFDRIEKNEYWLCVKCGGEIAEESLLANPTTLMCLACETGSVKNARKSGPR